MLRINATCWYIMHHASAQQLVTTHKSEQYIVRLPKRKGLGPHEVYHQISLGKIVRRRTVLDSRVCSIKKYMIKGIL
jgi:hypothetical protein